MKVALTGASGFLGRHLIDHLHRNNHAIVALSRSPPASKRTSVQWITGDLRDDDSVRRLVCDADAVVHTALDRGSDRFMDHPDDPVDYFDANVIGSLRLMHQAHQSDVQRFIFISSGAVHQHVVPGILLNEDHPLRPGSLYGAAKASAETLVHAYGLSGRLSACTLRPPTIYGVADPVTESRWYALIRNVVSGRDVAATGGGKVVHVSDLAAAATKMLNSNAVALSGKTFNTCDGFVSEYEVASFAKEISSSKSAITGPAKSESTPMQTAEIEGFGIRFGGKSLLHETITAIVDQIRTSS